VISTISGWIPNQRAEQNEPPVAELDEVDEEGTEESEVEVGVEHASGVSVAWGCALTEGRMPPSAVRVGQHDRRGGWKSHRSTPERQDSTSQAGFS
jgi:hypothetical protein